jgi:hypothetical protein
MGWVAIHPVEQEKNQMARIAGVNIPTNKRVEIALTYIHGIGNTKAKEITAKLGIAASRRIQDLTDQEVLQIRETIDAGYTVEGDLRRTVAMKAFPFAASARTPMRAPARVRPSQSPVKRSNPVGLRSDFPLSRYKVRTATWHANHSALSAASGKISPLASRM